MSDRAESLSVAVLGTGIMGAAMARNLRRAGHDVRAWNRTRAKAEPLAADGVRVTDAPHEAAEGADMVLTMVHDGPAAAEALRAAAPGLRRGAVWLQSTTVGPDGLAPLRVLAEEYGLVFVDAPVLGTRQPAEAGKLVVLAAGPESVRSRVAPVFDAVGARTIWAGEEPGDASRLKLVCNSWVMAVTHGAAEAMALAEGLGVAPDDFLAAVGGGPLDMGYLHIKTDAMRAGDYSPSFAVRTALKDSGLIVSAAERAGVRLDVARAGAERFARVEQAGHGDEDIAASYRASFDEGPAEG